jgi:hypothetical protein
MAARKSSSRTSGGRKTTAKRSSAKKSSAKKSTRKYSPSASKDVESAMRRRKKGTLRSGPGGKGGKVTSKKQAIAIGLSEARAKGKKVAKKSSAKKSSAKRSSAKKTTRRKTTRKKTASRR